MVSANTMRKGTIPTVSDLDSKLRRRPRLALNNSLEARKISSITTMTSKKVADIPITLVVLVVLVALIVLTVLLVIEEITFLSFASLNRNMHDASTYSSPCQVFKKKGYDNILSLSHPFARPVEVLRLKLTPKWPLVQATP